MTPVSGVIIQYLKIGWILSTVCWIQPYGSKFNKAQAQPYTGMCICSIMLENQIPDIKILYTLDKHAKINQIDASGIGNIIMF